MYVFKCMQFGWNSNLYVQVQLYVCTWSIHTPKQASLIMHRLQSHKLIEGEYTYTGVNVYEEAGVGDIMDGNADNAFEPPLFDSVFIQLLRLHGGSGHDRCHYVCCLSRKRRVLHSHLPYRCLTCGMNLTKKSLWSVV